MKMVKKVIKSLVIYKYEGIKVFHFYCVVLQYMYDMNIL